ncbi:YbbR-like domain-containing protein [Fulvivirga sediminis]|uniref:YbbR-like domain-containing protein n=1 Tax=Fulvivirga sediminis TaxID=2803949 RepID=A0A937F5P7_9BACT|nr:hypothetical protein [Fulvivirga sediminis]MBL3654583.1 hypothetical protein [Fulvivirga sediminis]
MSRIKEILRTFKPESSNNVRVIVLCVFAATTFWFLNALNENYSTTLKYPVRFIYDQDSYMAVERLPENVQLNVSGLGWNLFRNSLGIKVTPLEIPLETPADYKKIVGTSLPGLISEQLDEFQLNYVLTDTLFVNIERRISRTFHLSVDSTTIALDQDFKIVSPIVFSPDSVLLQGPENILNEMPDTVFVKIPQEDIDENYKEDVSISIPNQSLIHRNPPTLNVRFDVAEFISQKRTVPLTLDSFPEEFIPVIKEVEITYSVAGNREEEVGDDSFSIVLDFKSMDKQDSTILPVLAEFPDFVQNVQLDSTRIGIEKND